jgi:ABC-type amino acid transport substrate-binding protein
MKKLIALTLALALALTLCACGKKTPQTATSGEGKEMVQGTLSMLNITEEEFAAYQEARRVLGRQLIKEGYVERTEGTSNQGRMTKIVFYDTLDALLMALNVGDINEIAIYQSVARYLCATNDNLCMPIRYDLDKERNTFAEVVLNSFVNNNDFAFLMMESSAALRDEFNAAIADMKADGTLDRLVKEQIDDLVNGGEIKPIALPKIDGAETVKVAVTGALPPMDYVAADGTPAGFNTAVLAEIGQRTGKNIELVVVDSVGRATALASGTVDAVFWTRTSSASQERASMTEAEREAGRKKIETGMTEEEINLMNEMRNHIDFLTYGTADMPEGTIVTEPYFSDVLVPVMLAGGGPQGK